MTLTQTQLVMWVYLTSTDGTIYKCQHPSGRVPKRDIDIILYLLLTKCEVRTVSYGLSFFLALWPKRKKEGKKEDL